MTIQTPTHVCLPKHACSTCTLYPWLYWAKDSEGLDLTGTYGYLQKRETTVQLSHDNNLSHSDSTPSHLEHWVHL